MALRFLSKSILLTIKNNNIMTLKNLLVCGFAATMSFMTTNAFAADDYVVVKTTYDDPDGTLIDWDKEKEFGGFKGIELGDKVRITTDIIDADPQLQIVVKVYQTGHGQSLSARRAISTYRTTAFWSLISRTIQTARIL